MEPFSIQCTTCQARLRVRDESAIGQILSCPKCGSMVLVEAPETSTETPGPPTQPPSSSSTDSSSSSQVPRANPTEVGPESSADQQAGDGSNPVDEVSAAEDTTSSRPPRTFKFREDFQMPSEPVEGKKPRKPATPAPPKQNTASAADTTTPAAHPAGEGGYTTPDEAVSPTTRRYQQYLLIAAAAVLGLALATLMIGIFAWRGSDNQAVQDEDKTVQAPEASADPQSTALESDAKTEPESSNDSQAKGESNSAKKSDVASQKASRRKGSSPSIGPEDKVGSEDGPAARGDAKAPEKKKAASSDSKKTASKPSERAVAELPPPPVIEEGESVTETAPPPATEASDPTSTAAAGPENDIPTTNGVPALSEAETRERLSTTIVAIEHSQIPLADFARLVSGLTGLPVTLDVDVLPVIDITVETPLAFDLRGVTAREILEAALNPVGLRHCVNPGQVLITARQPIREKLVPDSYHVSDLTEGPHTADELANRIVSLVAAGSWDREGGEGTLAVRKQTLEIEQTALVHFRISRFLDRLRAVRGLPQSGDLPTDGLEIPPAFVQAATQLNTPLTATFIEPTAFRKIMDYIESETKLHIVADWQALAELNLGPFSSRSIKLPQQPLRELLDAWLAPMKLDYRVIDPDTLQISTREAINARLELELYPLEGTPDDAKESLVSNIETRVDNGLLSEDKSSGAAVYDESSHCLFLSLPRPAQRDVYAWLRDQNQVDFAVSKADR